jgi:hypothetical protein
MFVSAYVPLSLIGDVESISRGGRKTVPQSTGTGPYSVMAILFYRILQIHFYWPQSPLLDQSCADCLSAMIWRYLLRTGLILPVLLRLIRLYHPFSRDVNEISVVPSALEQAPFRPATGHIDQLVEIQSFQPRREFSRLMSMVLVPGSRRSAGSPVASPGRSSAGFPCILKMAMKYCC